MTKSECTGFIVPVGFTLRFRHYSPKNSSKAERDGKKWMTSATLWQVDSDGKLVKPVLTSRSWCSHLDNPSRKIGRAVALGRLNKCLQSIDINAVAARTLHHYSRSQIIQVQV